MQPSTLDRNLAAFGWLPLDRWNPDQLFNTYRLTGGNMCKICDDIVPVNEQERHVMKHIREERARLVRVKEGVQDAPVVVGKINLGESEKIVAACGKLGEQATLAGLATHLGRSYNEVRLDVNTLIQQGKLEVVGEHRVPGQRGRAAKIYAGKEGDS